MKDSPDAENYVKCHLPRKQRSALAKFRAGVPPINIEFGRYRGLPREQRKCFSCVSEIEDECHVLLYCPIYEDIRYDLFREINNKCEGFTRMSDIRKLGIILSQEDFYKASARACYEIINRRRFHVYI
jgi:hypothetical protein